MSLIQLVKIYEDGSYDRPLSADDLTLSVCQATSEVYRAKGYEEPWLSYLAVIEDRAVGVCGFKSPPDLGRIEMTFYTFPEFEGRGVGTAMAKALVEIALGQQRDIEIAAFSEPHESGMTTILRKLGFQFSGLVGHQEEGEVWEWVYARLYH